MVISKKTVLKVACSNFCIAASSLSNFKADTKTAGSIALLIQIGLPCLLFKQDEITCEFIGGTNVDFSPDIDYIIYGVVIKS